MGKDILSFDIMQGGRYVTTMKMPFCRLFAISDRDITEYVENKLPTLKGADYKIEFNGI